MKIKLLRHNLVQVGIRSCDVEEMQYVPKGQCFWAHEIAENPNWIEDVLSKVSGNVYITIDLDAFDPSIAPSTGTPEPEGLAYYHLAEKQTFIKSN